MFTDMFNSLEAGKEPIETFYDGYVVNAIMDAAYNSVKTKQWEPIVLDYWRGKTGVPKMSGYVDYDADHYFIKDEILPNGDVKVIIKHKVTGLITETVKLSS
jgi:hypothetical protein